MKRLLQILAVSFLFACEQDITTALPNAEPLIGFDAWLYHKPETQTIDIYRTNPYFDSSSPDGISGAVVNITNIDDPSENYLFTEESDGIYTWDPLNPADTFGTMGASYYLSVDINGILYESFSQINRVPTIDSITWRFDEENAFMEESFFANFWARDFEGVGDRYWIKSWKNDTLLNKPSELNIAYDAAFSEDGNADGLIFIQPIRETINPFEFDDDDVLLNPFVLGDSIYVEINSITPEAFFFLQQVQIQTARDGGFGELFAVPLANIQTNIFSEDTSEKAVGFFCISASSGFGKVFTEDDIRIVD